MSTQSDNIKGHENIVKALYLIHRFGWLRPQEIGRYIWPGSKHFEMYGVRLGLKLQKLELVISRKLPRHFGTALVLSRAGSLFLNREGVKTATTGKDIGSTDENGIWIPRLSWEHELLANSTLILLKEMLKNAMLDFKTENEYRNANKDFIKAPDGIILMRNGALWLEVENSKKSGSHMHYMMKHAINLFDNGESMFQTLCREVVFVYPDYSIDPRGYKINHRHNLINAFKENLAEDRQIKVTFIKVTQKSGAAVTANITAEVITGSQITAEAKALQQQASEAHDSDLDDDDAISFQVDLLWHEGSIEHLEQGYLWQVAPDTRQLDVRGGFEEFYAEGITSTKNEAWNAVALAVNNEIKRRKGKK